MNLTNSNFMERARYACGRDCLMYHEEVVTLFHETGHAMHMVLGEVGFVL